MSELFDIGHEDGDLDEYDSTVEDSGDLSVSSGAALADTDYGLSLVIDDFIGLKAKKNISLSTGDIRWRFYIDPNGLSMSTDAVALVQSITLSMLPWRVGHTLLHYDGSNYEIRATAVEDDGTECNTAYYDITDGEHYIEVYLQRSGSAGVSNGKLDLWIDGVHKEQVTGVDNFHAWLNINGCMLGFDRWDGTISGTYYLDEYVANDDGDEIGAVESSGSSSVAIFRRRIEGAA